MLVGWRVDALQPGFPPVREDRARAEPSAEAVLARADGALERHKPAADRHRDPTRHIRVALKCLHGVFCNLWVGPLIADLDFDVIGDSTHSAHALNGILGRELLSVAVDKSRERDFTILRDDGDIVRPDLGILVELAPHGVM